MNASLRHDALRLPANRGRAGWAAILGEGPAPLTLEGDETADFLIVGAGFAGLSAALRLHLAEPKARIAVLEAARIAEGSSGRNSGFMVDLPHDLTSSDYSGHGGDAADHEIIALNREAIAFAGGAVERFGIDRNFFDPVGKVNGAASEKADALNASYARHLAALGEPSERLDAAQMAEMTGSRHYLSGLYTPGTVMLQPAGYVRGLAAGLRAGGIRIHEEAPVRALLREGTAWRAATERGSVSAPVAILATNGHLESFGFARGRLMHIFLYASLTAELSPEALRALGGRARWGITPSDPLGTSMRRIDGPLGGNRILTRSHATFLPGMRVSDAQLARAAREHRRKFAERFPMLRDVRMERVWSGHLCLTRNDVSIMEELEPGLFAACVCNGLGTTRSTLTGIAVADLVLGHDSAPRRHFAAMGQAPRLPPRPFSTIGANLYLAWRGWRARAE